MGRKTAVLCGLLTLLASCSSAQHNTSPAGQTGTAHFIQIDGAKSILPISEAVVAEFQKSNSSLKFAIGVSGTGGGFQNFCSGSVDILDASRPIKSSEVEECSSRNIQYIELPLAYDGVVLVVNPNNTWVDYLTTDELSKLWDVKAQGKVMKWNDLRASWPDRDIHLFGPETDSGAYDYFTQAINGAEGVARGDYTASEEDSVLVKGISGDELALGYFGFANYERNKETLKLVPIDDSNSTAHAGPVLPSVKTVLDGLYQPLSRPIFLYIRADSPDQPALSAFVGFYLQNAAKIAGDVHFIPLPARAYALALERFRHHTTGSVFGGRGAQVGIRIEQLVEKETRETPLLD